MILSLPTELTTTDQTIEDIPMNLGVISTMCTEGDIKYTWDPKSAWDVAAARSHFENLKKRGFRIFKMRRWRADVEVEEFDPTHGRLLFQAPTPDDMSDDWADVQGTDGELVEPDPEAADHYVAVPPVAGG